MAAGKSPEMPPNPPAKEEPTASKEKKPPKREKPPAVEDKPFADFMHQDYLPALKAALQKSGIDDIELSLEKKKIPISGIVEDCWQVIGHWQAKKRQFNIYFFKADIKGPKAFSCSDGGSQVSTLESFLIDERKITLPLLVFGLIQRLNAQKWLTPN